MLKPRFRSLRFRLTAWYAAILGITFLLGAVVVSLTLMHSIKATVDKELRARLRTVRQYVSQEASGQGVLHLREELNEDAVVSSASAYLRIADASGSWIYRSPNTERWPPLLASDENLPDRGVIHTLRIHGRAMRVLSAPVKVGTVQIGLPLDEFEEAQRDFIWTIALGIPLLLCIASIGGYWMSSRALKPVDRIAGTAERITYQNLSERLPIAGTGDEIDRLSEVLNQMLSRLDSAFRRITQFTADASHELRTPLAIIRTTAEVIRGRTRSLEEHDNAWAAVLAQTERTSELVNDLLTLARADSGLNELQFETVQLDDVVNNAFTDMQVMARSKGIELSLWVEERVIISGDADALRRVFTILLDNAVKATPPGGRINISLRVERAAEVFNALVTVEDTGTGIPQEYLPQIFDRFYRVNPDRSRDTGGAGLGLAIAQSIVNRLKGKIEVRSELGCGATFRVILPGCKTLTDSEILQNRAAS